LLRSVMQEWILRKRWEGVDWIASGSGQGPVAGSLWTW